MTGRAVATSSETLEEAYASRASYGAPDWEVDGWVTTYAAIADGSSTASAIASGGWPATSR